MDKISDRKFLFRVLPQLPNIFIA